MKEKKLKLGGHVRPIPTGLISRRPTAIFGRFPLADSKGLNKLNMFDSGNWPTITESVV